MIQARTLAAGLLLTGFLLAGEVRLASGQEKTSVQESVAAAQAAIRQRRYSEAVHLLEGARKRFPTDPQLRIELGKAYVYDRQDSRATKLFQDVLLDDPSNRAAKLELARVLSYDGKYEASDQLFRQLLALDPADEASAIGLVRNLMRQGRTDEARRETDQALAHHPNSLRLQEYRDAIEQKRLIGEGSRQEVRANRVQGEASYFSDTTGNRSWRTAQRFDYQIARNLTSGLRLEERSLWVSQGPKANVFSGTNELRLRLSRGLQLGGGGGVVRFADSSSRALYRGELLLHPFRSFWLQGGFSRIPVYPTFQSAQFNLLAEGWWARADLEARSWRVNADFFKQHYSDSNRTQREDAEVLRWVGSTRLALGIGYRYAHALFAQNLSHGYFSPSQYHSHLGLGGFRFGVGRVYRAEYIGRFGTEWVSQNAYRAAWEATARNRFLLGSWELSADYSYFHFAQSTGASRAQTGRVAIAYRF